MRALHGILLVIVVPAFAVFGYLVLFSTSPAVNQTGFVTVGTQKFGVIYPQNPDEGAPLVFFHPAASVPQLLKLETSEPGKSGYVLRGGNFLPTNLDKGAVIFVNNVTGQVVVRQASWDREVLADKAKMAALAAACCTLAEADSE